MFGSDSSKDLVDANAQLAHLLLQENEGFFEQLIDINPIDFAGTARKPKHLPDDVRDSFSLLSRNLKEPGVLVVRGAILHQVKCVFDRFERIVDFMGDRGGETAYRSKLFRFK